MVNNSDKSGNKTKTTEKYKLITKTLEDGLSRLMADKSYYQSMVISTNPQMVRQGKTGLKATIEQIFRHQRAITIDHTENVQAFNRGEINKFW